MTSTPETTEQRPCWFVGAWYDDGTGDQTAQFLREGIWENGWSLEKDTLVRQVDTMRPGDHIAIKSTSRRKDRIPFDNQGRFVSIMAIKAVGTITENMGNGCHVRVNWRPVIPVREWYFYTYRSTIWEVWPGKGARPWAANGLISFAFENKPQDYDRFLKEWQ